MGLFIAMESFKSLSFAEVRQNHQIVCLILLIHIHVFVLPLLWCYYQLVNRDRRHQRPWWWIITQRLFIFATLLMRIAVNQGPILSNTIIPPSSDVEELEVPGWVKNAAKMLNGGIEGQDWLALSKKLGESYSSYRSVAVNSVQPYDTKRGWYLSDSFQKISTHIIDRQSLIYHSNMI